MAVSENKAISDLTLDKLILKEALGAGIICQVLVGQACRTLGVSEQSYYRWRKEYGDAFVHLTKCREAIGREAHGLRYRLS